jgi:hypothetical protein
VAGTGIFDGSLRAASFVADGNLTVGGVVGLTDGLTGVGRNPSGSYSSRDVVMFTAGGGDALLVTAGGIGVESTI